MISENINKVIKIAAISDTHGKNEQLSKMVTNNISGDIFIHAGDYSFYNKKAHFQQFINLLSKLNFKHKIVIPGNHEILMDKTFTLDDLKAFGVFIVPQGMDRQSQIQKFQQIGVTYLEHDYLQLSGIKFFASAYTILPPYWQTAFQIHQKKISQIWEGVPSEIDILITHGPPFGILDKTIKNENAGSLTIKQFLDKSSPKIHIFGHIHQSSGMAKHKNTMCYNVAQSLKLIQLQLFQP